MPETAPARNASTPKGLQPFDIVRSASPPPPEFSTTATTDPTCGTEFDNGSGYYQTDASNAPSMSSSFLDWLETHVQSYDEKRRLSEQFQAAESELNEDPKTIGMAKATNTQHDITMPSMSSVEQLNTGIEPAGESSKAFEFKGNKVRSSAEYVLPRTNQKDQVESESLDSWEDTSSSPERPGALAKKGPKSSGKNKKKAQSESKEASPSGSPHAKQPSRQDEGKDKKGKGPAAPLHKQRKDRPRLNADDMELAKAVERIHANDDLTRGLVIRLAQQIPEARKMIVEL